jgi:hypothetical protein
LLPAESDPILAGNEYQENIGLHSSVDSSGMFLNI